MREAIACALETMSQLWELMDVADAEGPDPWKSRTLRHRGFTLTRILCEQATQINRELTLAVYPTYGKWDP